MFLIFFILILYKNTNIYFLNYNWLNKTYLPFSKISLINTVIRKITTYKRQLFWENTENLQTFNFKMKVLSFWTKNVCLTIVTGLSWRSCHFWSLLQYFYCWRPATISFSLLNSSSCSSKGSFSHCLMCILLLN